MHAECQLIRGGAELFLSEFSVPTMHCHVCAPTQLLGRVLALFITHTTDRW